MARGIKGRRPHSAKPGRNQMEQGDRSLGLGEKPGFERRVAENKMIKTNGEGPKKNRKKWPIRFVVTGHGGTGKRQSL